MSGRLIVTFQFFLVATDYLGTVWTMDDVNKIINFQFFLVATVSYGYIVIEDAAGRVCFQFFLVATEVIIFPGCLNILWSRWDAYPNHAPLHRGTTCSVGIDQQYSVIVWLSGFPALIIAYIWAHETLFSSFTINNYCFGFFFYYAS